MKYLTVSRITLKSSQSSIYYQKKQFTRYICSKIQLVIMRDLDEKHYQLMKTILNLLIKYMKINDKSFLI